MRRNPGRKNRRTSAPITRAVATIAPRTSSDNARPSGPSLFEDCALDSRRKRLRPMGAYIRPRRARHESESRQDLCAGFRRGPNGGIPEGDVVLGSGAPGTMKSSLPYSILYQDAIQTTRKSAILTLGTREGS